MLNCLAMSARAVPVAWFGGKSRAASLIWPRFGDVPNYVEPFAGSLAVLLARPHDAGTETVNDADCYLVNFWRAIQNAPEAVSRWADWPVTEADLLARHEWLIAQSDFRQLMRTRPDFFDAKIAGWWVWGVCSWIGSGWCAERRDGHPPEQTPASRERREGRCYRGVVPITRGPSAFRAGRMWRGVHVRRVCRRGARMSRVCPCGRPKVSHAHACVRCAHDACRGPSVGDGARRAAPRAGDAVNHGIAIKET
jgi:hypothetical protein